MTSATVCCTFKWFVTQNETITMFVSPQMIGVTCFSIYVVIQFEFTPLMQFLFSVVPVLVLAKISCSLLRVQGTFFLVSQRTCK